jgi:RNA polymerase sigma-70 factor (ECF subfamily)
MSPPQEHPVSAAVSKGETFATTHWTVVLQAGGSTSAESARALEQLCQTYWYPLYSFARSRGPSHHDAQDLTQGFFTFLLEKDVIQRADRRRGRFRTFLLSSFRHFQENERARSECLKRGGGRLFIRLDAFDGETRYAREPATHVSPERLYDQRWAASLLETVVHRLDREYIAAGRTEWFEELKPAVWGGRGEVSYADIAGRLGATEGAVKVAVHRLRGRFRETLREEVGHTVADANDIEDEIRHLLSALSL